MFVSDAGNVVVVSEVNSRLILTCPLNTKTANVSRWSYRDESIHQEFANVYNGQKISTKFLKSGRFSVTSGSNSLKIERLQLNDSGIYRCLSAEERQFPVTVVSTSDVCL